MSQLNLEPRVAKLETGLEILTRDVTTLASVVREQSRNLEGELQKLTVAVTQANSPRKTEWHTLIALGMFLLAIGSAIFIPLHKDIANNKSDIHEFQSVLLQHVQSEGHPVTGTIIKANEARINKLETANSERIDADLAELREIKRKVVEYHMGAIPSTNR